MRKVGGMPVGETAYAESILYRVLRIGSATELQRTRVTDSLSVGVGGIDMTPERGREEGGDGERFGLHGHNSICTARHGVPR